MRGECMSETGKGDQLEVQHWTMTSWQNSTVIICTYSNDSMPAPKSFRLSSSGWVSRSAASTKPSTCGDSCAHTQCYRLVIVRGSLRRDVHDGVQSCQGAATIVDDLAYTSALLSAVQISSEGRDSPGSRTILHSLMGRPRRHCCPRLPPCRHT